MSVVVIEPPAPVVSLDLARQHLRLDGFNDDLLVQAYLAAAQGMIDGPGGWLGRCIGPQTLEMRLDGFPQPIWGWSSGWNGLSAGAVRIALPYPPLIGVVSVTYEDATGASVAMPSSAYLATDEGLGATFGNTLPNGRWEPNAVRIRYQAGYVENATADPLVAAPPAAVVAAILLMTGDLFANRETVVDSKAAVSVPMSTTVEALLQPFRVWA